MALLAYRPLENVYQFHEIAERWILRRWPAQRVIAAGGEAVRGQWSESWVDVFPDRSTKSTAITDAGQDSPQTCTVYLRTRLLTTDKAAGPQPADVLFDGQGRAWQARSQGEWDEARGFATVMQRNGSRGQPPWS